jgi:hypothetical protein
MSLHPATAPRPTSSQAERIFYLALVAGLPKGWSAWHSLRVRAGTIWEGESDFVIAVPDRAILIIEVKGGAIECRDGHWFQNGTAMDRSPRDQAHGFLRVLKSKLEQIYTGPLPPMIIATAFPQTPFQTPPSHGDLTNAVLGQQDLPWLGAALEAMVEKQLGRSAPVKDHGWSSALHRLWGETWVPRISLGARIELRGHELVPLDADQLAFITMLDHSERLHISGGPGTGKTLLAHAVCERRAPALYLCWTRALAVAMCASGIADAWTVREYAAHLLGQAGVPVAGGAPPSAWSPEVWETIALQAAVDAVPATRAHRIVVVDEAQDFAESEWELVKALAGDGPLWAFGDAGQSFWPERGVPKGLFGGVFQLKARYRCPEALATFADLYRPGSESARPTRCPDLRVVAVNGDDKAAFDRVKIEITKALKDGAKPGDIAVLSLRGQTKSDLFKEKRVGDVALVRADAPDASEHVVADTFLRFKGLERPYVIVTELSAGPERYEVRMHVALTRATLACVVVGTEEEITRDARLAALR